MKKIIYKSFFFIFILISGIILSIFILEQLNNHRLKTYLEDTTFDTTVIGDSHIQKAINDSLLTNTINISQSSENYYYSYYKIVKLLKLDHSIKKIYLGLNYHSFSSYYDSFVCGQCAMSILPRYFLILPIKEKISKTICNHSEMVILLKGIYINGLKNLFVPKNKMSFLGNFENEFIDVAALKNSMDKRLSFQFYSDCQIRSFSERNLEYLQKIITLCHENNVELVLLITPIHKYYKENIPSVFIDKLNKIVNNNMINLIDLNIPELSDNYYIPDGDHVSLIGSTLITNKLRNFEDL